MPEERIVPPHELPATLWESGVLRLAPILVSAYRKNLESRGLLGVASCRDGRDSPVGGLTEEETFEHFALAFDGSAARVQLALTDPKMELEALSNVLMTSCSGGTLALLDLPCGAGAFSFALLCSIAELRRAEVLPREPLDVIVVGGELSKHARKVAEDMSSCCLEELRKQAIHVTWQTVHWDVCDKGSTTQLNQRFIADADGKSRKLVAMSNFNGFLSGNGKQKRAAPQIEEIFRYATGGPWSVAVWIEPMMNRAKEQIFPWVRKQFDKVRSALRLAPKSAGQKELSTSAPFQPPLQENGRAMVRLSVDRFELGPD